MKRLWSINAWRVAIVCLFWAIFPISFVFAAPGQAISNQVGDTNTPGLLPEQILAVYNAGFSNVTINPGTYSMPESDGPVFHFKGWTNFTINASNTLFLVGTSEAFVLTGCSNVTLQGTTVRTRTFPFTQGRIINAGHGQDGKVYVDWRIDAGYPTTFQWWFTAVNGGTRKIRLDAGDIYYDPRDAEYLNDQTWRLHFNGRTLNFYTNDWLVSRTVGSQGFAFDFNECRNCTFQDLTSQCGYFATYHEYLGGGNRMIRCRAQPSPAPPPGGVEPPVVGCGADGLHSIGAYPGLLLEDCVFEGVFLDDNVAIHGSYQTMNSAAGNMIILNSRSEGLEVGGQIFYDSSTGGFEIGGAVRISNGSGFFAEAVCTDVKILPNGKTQVTLDRNLDVPLDAVACNPKYNGSGYRILNCRFGNCRSRAIIVKADDGLISGCTIENSQSAIQIGPERYWYEADYVRNVAVTNNVIRHCGYFGINVVGDGVIGNSDLAIRNNWIDDTTLGNGLKIQWSRRINIAGNVFANTGPYPAIALDHCDSIDCSDNFVTNGPPAGIALAQVGPTVSAIQGLQNGLVLTDVPPNFPASFTATAGGQQVWLRWNSVNGAAHYDVQRATAAEGPYQAIATGLDAPSYNDFGLTNGTTYYYRLSQTAADSASVNSTPYENGLPAPWQVQDIGSVGLAGSSHFTNGTFYIDGSGSDIWDNTDAFHFAYRSMGEDGTVILHVAEMQDTDPWAKAGIMIRDDTSPWAKELSLFATPRTGVSVQWRTLTAFQTGGVQIPGVTAPVWLKLVRQGERFDASYGTDGTNWISFNLPLRMAMNSTVLAGPAVTSRNNSTLCRAAFDHVTLFSAQPRLSATLSGNELTLTWAAEPGFSLASTPSLLSPVLWQPVTNSPANFGGTFTIILPVNHENRFFKLETR